MLTVHIRERDGGERRLVFGTEEVPIGRAKGSDILLPRNNISKRHARLVDKDDKVVLVDLRSTNGTYVNGRRITAPEVIGPKDKIYIGDFVMKVESVTSPQHEHTMPQPPVSETAMMDPAPLTEDQEPEIDDLDEGIEISDLVTDDAEGSQDEAQHPHTDPGLGASAVVQAEDASTDDVSDAPDEAQDEATAALDLDELGLSADEAEEVALAPTRHRGMEEESAAAPPDAELEEAPEAGEAAGDDDDDDGIAFEDFEIDIDGDEGFEPIDPALAPPTRQAPPPEPITTPAPEQPEVGAEAEAQAPAAEPATDAPPLSAEAIDAMLGDLTVDGILINACDSVAVRRGAVATVIPSSFATRAELDDLALSLAKRAGIDLGDDIVDGELPGDLNLQIVPKAMAPNGPLITITRTTSRSDSADDLVENGTLTDPIRDALASAVSTHKNIVVVGNGHSERATVLNALMHFAAQDARVAVIADTREFAPPQKNALLLDKGALMGAGESFLDVVPRLDADHVLIDPISAEDVVELVGLALGGHDGLLVSYKGRSANAVLRRMSLAVELAVGAALGERARDMVAEAIDLIVVVDHAEGGVVVREVITVDDAGPSGFRTSEILAYS